MEGERERERERERKRERERRVREGERERERKRERERSCVSKQYGVNTADPLQQLKKGDTKDWKISKGGKEMTNQINQRATGSDSHTIAL